MPEDLVAEGSDEGSEKCITNGNKKNRQEESQARYAVSELVEHP